MKAITNQENNAVIRAYFKHGLNGKLAILPRKESKRLVVLRQLSARFTPGREYSEKEVNSILSEVYQDYVTLRRNLVEYGFMVRLQDGSKYWAKTAEE